MGDSNSIENQKAMLMKYAIENGFRNIEVFVDDGYSGVFFNRPAFQKILNLIKENKVETLITKDYCAIIGLNQKDLENQGILA